MIDWELTIKNLRKSGLTYKDISMETGFCITDLKDMETGDFVPQWISCLKVLDLHLEHCPARHKTIFNHEELFHE